MSEEITSDQAATLSAQIDKQISEEFHNSLDRIIGVVVRERVNRVISGKVDHEVSLNLNKTMGPNLHIPWISALEDIFENWFLFSSRWLLAPAYAIIVLVLAVLSYKAIEEFVQLAYELKYFNEGRTLTQVLVVIDIVLVMNLTLMVLYVGYTNFVSVIHPSRIEDWPSWTHELDYSGLKLKLIGSVIAISSINLLREIFRIMNENDINVQRVLLLATIHVVLVISVLIIAIVNRMDTKHSSIIDAVNKNDVSGAE